MRSPATSPCRFTLFLAAAAALCWVPAAYAVAADARLVAPPGSETELKATLSAEVRALPVALHQPVTKGAILYRGEWVQDLDPAQLVKLGVIQVM